MVIGGDKSTVVGLSGEENVVYIKIELLIKLQEKDSVWDGSSEASAHSCDDQKKWRISNISIINEL